MMFRCVFVVAAGLAAVSLAGCLTEGPSWQHTDIPVWQHFDSCSDRTAFHEWVTCAKARRDAICTNTRACAPGFFEVLAYAEGLDEAVRRRQISEPEARQKWAEYRASKETAKRVPPPDAQ
jgi:hypothetical protein